MTRDFAAAWHDAEKAAELSDETWIRLFPVQILEAEDRLEEAEERTAEILAEEPTDRGAIQLWAHLLRQRGDDEGSHRFLIEACERSDYPYLHLQIAEMDIDAERWEEAADRIRRFVKAAPALRLDRRSRRGITALRAQVLCHLGHRLDAADLLEEVDRRHTKKLVSRLRDPSLEDRRAVLDVPWVRQHHDTCSPATLTAICRFWDWPAEHLEIAEDICFGGTRSHSERRWARRNDLVAREFTVDWEAAVALVDRGIPFTLVTSDAVNAHLQAVVGYDVRRRSFVCRDPAQRRLVDYDADKLLETLAATGPRGMVLLPREDAERLRLTELDLPDSDLYELYDRVEDCLSDHRRSEAQDAAERLGLAAPGHRLELMARYALAAYDRDVPRLLSVVEEQLSLFPDDDRLKLARLGLLADLERRDERLSALRREAHRFGAEPSFSVMLALELLSDAGSWREAERLLAGALRARPSHSQAYDVLAQLAWLRGERDEACRLFRWAACLSEAMEIHQLRYLVASRETDCLEEALGFLRQRFERFGSRSARPAITLLSALDLERREEEARAVLEEAVRSHPEDGDLALARIARHARRNELEAAKELLSRFEGRADEAGWLEHTAEVAEIEGDLVAALAAERKILALEPTSAERHHRVARLLALTEGQPAALEHLRAAVDDFPHHVQLGELLVEWSWREGTGAVESALERLLEAAPDNGWAWRELAIVRLDLADLSAADEAVDRAAELEPTAVALDNLRGRLAEERGDLEAATAHYRQAIERDVDNAWALIRLPEVCPDSESRRRELRWAAGELGRSRTGHSVAAFHQQAVRYLPPEEVEELLLRLLDLRDLPPVHYAVAAQIAQRGRLEEASERLRDAVDRFPFETDLRMLEASVHQAAGRSEDERRAYEALLALDPRHIEAQMNLARLHLRQGRHDLVVEACESARARNPFDPEPFLLLADVCWAKGDVAGCLEHLERALELGPERADLWVSFADMARSQGEPRRAEALAERLLEGRESDAHAWITLARVASDRGRAHQALDEAMRRAPRAVGLHVARAQILAMRGDLAAAFAACRPSVFDDEGRERPRELVLAEGRILAQQGNFEGALEVISTAVERDPSYAEGWGLLSEWAVEGHFWERALEATERWIHLAPMEAAAHGLRGRALRAVDRVDEATDCYHQALEYDPSYAPAALELGEMLVESGEGRKALRILARCADSGAPHGAILAEAVSLAARFGGHVHAGRWIQAMAHRPEVPPELLGELVSTLAEHNPHYLKLYDQAAFLPEALAPLGVVRVLGLTESDGFNPAWKHLLERRCNTKAWGEAAAALLQLQMEKRPNTVFGHAQRYKEALRVPTASWSCLGFVLARGENWKDVVDVLGDYQEREDVDAWPLYLLSFGLRQLGRFDESCAVARDGLGLPEHPVQNGLRIWVALWEALEGDAEAARRLPESMEMELEEQEDKLFFRIAKALGASAGRRGDETAYAEAKTWLRGSLPPVRCANSLQRKIYDRAARQIARDIGGIWARLWAECHLPR